MGNIRAVFFKIMVLHGGDWLSGTPLKTLTGMASELSLSVDRYHPFQVAGVLCGVPQRPTTFVVSNERL
jgi:hypothetical protein